MTWSANTEPDLAGYDLYRNGVKVNSSPISGTSYTDTGRANGTTYSYRIAAVDTHGNQSAQCSPVNATTSGTPPAMPDGGFESGADGATLAAPWFVSGTSQHVEYDNTRAKNGAQSAWIQGPTALTYSGFGETNSANLTANGAEQRFWLYNDTTNQYRNIDCPTAVGDRPFFIMLSNNGQIYVYTDRPGNPGGYVSAGHTSVGTYSTGWTELRIVYTFSGNGAQTYTLSKRSSASDPWTPLKAAGAANYDIPFRGTNTITKTAGTMFLAYQNTNMWVDDVSYSSSSQFTITPSAGPGGSISPAAAQTLPYGSSSGQYTITPGPGTVDPRRARRRGLGRNSHNVRVHQPAWRPHHLGHLRNPAARPRCRSPTSTAMTVMPAWITEMGPAVVTVMRSPTATPEPLRTCTSLPT